MAGVVKRRRSIGREQLQEVGEQEIRVLRILCEYDGLPSTARAVGVSDATLLRVMAGLGHRCNHLQMQAVRRFFADFDFDGQGKDSSE